MSLGKRISANFHKLTTIKGLDYHEQELFTKLEDAIILSANKNIFASLIHGQRSMVTFLMNKKEESCELGDMFFFIIDYKKGEGRIAIFQFKREEKNTKGNKLKVAYNQLYLYRKRCKFISGKAKKIVKQIKLNGILKLAEFYSFTSYGFFYKNTSLNNWDMKYAAAKYIKLVKSKVHKEVVVKIKRPKRVRRILFKYQQAEYLIADDIRTLFDKMEDMLIGQPVNINTFVKLVCHSTYSNKSLFNRDDFEERSEEIINNVVSDGFSNFKKDNYDFRSIDYRIKSCRSVCLIEINSSNVPNKVSQLIKEVHSEWDLL